MATINPDIAAAVARAREKIAAQKLAADTKAGKFVVVNLVKHEQTAVQKAVEASGVAVTVQHQDAATAWLWNQEQQTAIFNYGQSRKNFCLIGAAGTGKTTTLKGILKHKMEANLCPPLEAGTAWLSSGAPGIVLVSYTRRAVRNIAKQMPTDLRSHCMTIHKLIEFGPEYYTKAVFDEQGNYAGERNAMRFAPQRHEANPLPRNLTTIVIDEASMVSIELFEQLWNALPNPHLVQFVILGDLNQLPPVYGQAILGKMLLENPIIELTQVYRQALESPIIALALAVKNNDFRSFNKDAVELWSAKAGFDAKNVLAGGGPVTLYREGRGKVTLHPWKVKWDQEEACTAIKGQINSWIAKGIYDPDEDLILCPWNEAFGTIELNKGIANRLAIQRKADVYEVISGFESHYLAVGDKLMIDKQEGIIREIKKNPKYMGKKPGPHSPFLDRWGQYQKRVDALLDDDIGVTDVDIDELLESLSNVEDRVAEASHTLKMYMLDTEEEMDISKAATINASSFAYASTVHKAQGSECRKVFFITHYCHSAMLMRELVYTAITRAAEELYIVMSPQMLATAASRPRIKGDTLAAKLAFYQERLKERMS